MFNINGLEFSNFQFLKDRNAILGVLKKVVMYILTVRTFTSFVLAPNLCLYTSDIKN